MNDLMYRTAPVHLRRARVLTGVFAAAGVALALVDAQARSGQLVFLGLFAALGALISGCSWVLSARAFTHCTPAGIRTRCFGRRRACPWPEVSNIAARRRGSTEWWVQVTTASGKRFWLGALIGGGVSPDPDFAGKVQQLAEYWHSMTGGPDTARPAAIPVDTRPGLTDQMWRWYFIALVPLFAAVMLPVSVRGLARGGPDWPYAAGLLGFAIVVLVLWAAWLARALQRRRHR